MKILYSSAQVCQQIRRIFQAAKGRRVAISAFIGDSASAYLPRPAGIELYCWPKAGGTNPNAIRDLLDRRDGISSVLWYHAFQGADLCPHQISAILESNN